MSVAQRGIRVVVADDSAFIRSIICSHLESVEGMEVVGTAENGREAVELVKRLAPDVLTLDVEMPQVGGLEALETIMLESPTPVVMVSGVSLTAAEVTLQAIEMGAVDFILKYIPGAKLDPRELRLDIISKVRAAAEIKVVRTIRARKLAAGFDSNAFRPASGASTKSFAKKAASSVVVVGASTGGPIAIKRFLARLPHEFPAPIVVVQHIPPPFGEVLAAQLRSQLPFEAAVVRDGEPLQPRRIHIAPGDRHVTMDNRLQLRLNDGPPINGHRPSIDVTMKSMAQYFPNDLYGILLTGMGSDGASGLKYIRSRGGRTFAQSAETCVVDGMPAAAIASNAVDHVASPEGIADKLVLECNRYESRRQAEDAAMRGQTAPGLNPRPVKVLGNSRLM